MNISADLLRIYERSITPFEKLDSSLSSTPQQTTADHQSKAMALWHKMISSQADPERIDHYFRLLDLPAAAIRKMLAPVSVEADAELPPWVQLLEELNNTPDFFQWPDLPSAELPFQHLLWPFAQLFRNRLEKKFNPAVHGLISPDLVPQLQTVLLGRLCTLAEVVLQQEFEHFQQSQLEGAMPEWGATTNYRSFVQQQLENRLHQLWQEYPMLARLLATITDDFGQFMSRVLQRFAADAGAIASRFRYPLTGKKVNAIRADIADPHDGECTLILELEGDYRLVYKPGSARISEAYNGLLAWVNEELRAGLRSFAVLDRHTYSWLEFVENAPCRDEAGVADYYRRAGYLLGITYFLNSSDYHYENLIAAGDCPVLIDHETLLQPQVKVDLSRLSEPDRKRFDESILRTSLLPAVNPQTGLSFGHMAGFGSSGNSTATAWARSIAYCNTDRSNRIMRQISLGQDQLNKPLLHGKKQHLRGYQSELINGFETLYDLFIRERGFLLGATSPLQQFRHCQIRYVWRPTNIYTTIQKQLLEAEWLRDATQYGLRLELLGRAYLSKAAYQQVFDLLAVERGQMLANNVPVFKTQTDSTAVLLPNGREIDLFEQDAMSCIERKLRQAGNTDLHFQAGLIREYAPL